MNSRNAKVMLLTITILMSSGCDRDPFSDRGKVLLPETEEQIKTGDSEYGVELISTVEAAELDSGIQEVEWDNLIPADWLPDPKLIEQYQAGEIGDDDPRVIEARRRLDAPVQPANKDLAGKRIKIPGFVVPLEVSEKKSTEFLLVPYHGACIHVPPPPTNQTVFVKTGTDGAAIRKQFDTVWVTGRIEIENIESDLAEAGYILYAEKVEPYQ